MAMEVVNHFTFLLSGFRSALDLYRKFRIKTEATDLKAYKLSSVQAKLAQNNSIANPTPSYRKLAIF